MIHNSFFVWLWLHHIVLMMMLLLFFTTLTVIQAAQVSQDISCRDENNNIVDWYYAYKLPKNKFSTNPLVKKGLAYMYITPDTVKQGWTLSKKSVNDTDSMFGLTLNHLYEDSCDHISVIYNDQPPSKILNTLMAMVNVMEQMFEPIKTGKRLKMSGGGHTKGVVISDKESGIWLIHSVPKFPPLPDNQNSASQVIYAYPNTGTRYGQSFLCLSLDASSMDTVGMQLSYNEPNIIFSQIPEDLKDTFKTITDIVENKTILSSPWSRVAKLKTRGGTIFKSFAKSGNFRDDLYSGLIAQYLTSDLLVESWINGPGVLESNCSFKYKVNNVEKIAFFDKNIAFSSHSDHSKWAVSVPQDSNYFTNDFDSFYWVCVGDINRARSQEFRGGGSVCFENVDLWNIYHNSINSVEPCNMI